MVVTGALKVNWRGRMSECWRIQILDWQPANVHNTEVSWVGETLSIARPRVARRGRMPEFFQRSWVQLSGWAALLVVLSAVGVYLITKLRRAVAESGQPASDMMTNFRELHSQGELSDEEYRTIKTTLAGRLQADLKGKGEEG